MWVYKHVRDERTGESKRIVVFAEEGRQAEAPKEAEQQPEPPVAEAPKAKGRK